MAKNQPVSATTQVGICNGNTEGYATLDALSAAIGGPDVTVSTAAPISGDGSAGSSITLTDANLAAAIGGAQACEAVRDCMEDSPAATAANFNGNWGVYVTNEQGNTRLIPASDLGLPASGGGTGGGQAGALLATGAVFEAINLQGNATPSGYTFTAPSAGVLEVSYSSYSEYDTSGPAGLAFNGSGAGGVFAQGEVFQLTASGTGGSVSGFLRFYPTA